MQDHYRLRLAHRIVRHGVMRLQFRSAYSPVEATTEKAASSMLDFANSAFHS